jgi:hypothetical protein
MKNLIQKIAVPLLAIGLIVGGVQQANAGTLTTGTVSYAATATLAPNTGTWTDLNLSQFNANLGTLTGVTIIIKQADLNGNFKVTPLDAGSAYVSALSSVLQIQGADNNSLQGYGDTLGYSAVESSKTQSSIVVSPVLNTVLTQNVQQEFDIASGTKYTISPANKSQVIDSAYIINYIGTGSVVFQAQDSFLIGLSAGTSTQDVTGVSAPVEVDVVYTYTYEVVPEPSTWAMIVGGVGMLAFTQRLRRRAA